jgi:hypothetical protein
VNRFTYHENVPSHGDDFEDSEAGKAGETFHWLARGAQAIFGCLWVGVAKRHTASPRVLGPNGR